MKIDDMDKMTLQRLLLTVAGGIGGTWKPSLSTVGDVVISSEERIEYTDGRAMIISHFMMATSTRSDGKPILSMVRELRLSESKHPFPARLNAAVCADCTFADADAVMTAVDACSEQLDAKVAELIQALEVAHV